MDDKTFEEIKKNNSELIMFLKEIPKGGDLHNHSLGGAYSEFIYENAKEKKLYYNTKNNCFLTEKEFLSEERKENFIKAEEIKNKCSEEFFNSYSIRGLKNKKDGASHFFSIFPRIISSGKTENELILEVLKRNELENMSYVEIISDCIPLEIIKKFKGKITEKEFSLENLDILKKRLEEEMNEENLFSIKNFLDEREDFLKKHGVKNIEVKYFPYLRRASSSLLEFFEEGFLFLWASLEDKRIAGVNIVEIEDDISSRENFESHLKILKYLYLYFKNKYKYKSINLSIHAGELTLERETFENMEDRIISTIFLDKKEREYPITKRIGHGVSICWESKETLNAMKNFKIPVEICLSSNEIILGVKGKDHPFNLYKKNNVPIVICTDDEGISRSNIIMEYFKAVSRYDLSYRELKKIIKNSLEFSFLEGESLYKDKDVDIYREEFEKLNSLEEIEKLEIKNRKFIDDNKKLKMQLELEKKLLKFEIEY